MAMESSTDLPAEVDRRLTALWRGLGRGGDEGLSRTATSVLALLRDSGPHRVTALATAEGVAQPSMTALVARLEKRGLVARGSDPDDARAVRVAVTDQGLERLEARRAVRVAALEDRLAALDAGEREVLLAALPVLDKLTEGSTT
jgi:DNA-binding MarR family transcriptional regulator